MNIASATYYSRLHRGWDIEPAVHCPVDKPLWIWQIEQEEGRSLREMLEEGARTAKVTGYSLSDMAAEWGLHKDTLGYWARKWGIHFPRNCSAKHRASAARVAKMIRPLRSRTLPRDERDRRRQALMQALDSVDGSQRALAARLGCCFKAVNDWLHDRRQVPDHWWAKLQEVAA